MHEINLVMMLRRCLELGIVIKKQYSFSKVVFTTRTVRIGSMNRMELQLKCTMKLVFLV